MTAAGSYLRRIEAGTVVGGKHDLRGALQAGIIASMAIARKTSGTAALLGAGQWRSRFWQDHARERDCPGPTALPS